MHTHLAHARMWVCSHAGVHEHVRAHVYVCRSKCAHVYTCVPVCAHMHACGRVWCAYTEMCTCLCSCVHVGTSVQACARTRVHVYTCRYAYACVCTHGSLCMHICVHSSRCAVTHMCFLAVGCNLGQVTFVRKLEVRGPASPRRACFFLLSHVTDPCPPRPPPPAGRLPSLLFSTSLSSWVTGLRVSHPNHDVPERLDHNCDYPKPFPCRLFLTQTLDLTQINGH